MSDMHHEHAEPSDSGSTPKDRAKILLVDDEDRFRKNLAQRLAMRGYDVRDVDDGEEAIRIVRLTRPDIVILDRKMPKIQGEEVLKEVKKLAPEVQVIMLTGHADIESAAATGKLDAFAYLQKPCETDELITTIEAARRERAFAMERHEMPVVTSRSVRAWLWGTHNSRPGFIILGALILAAFIFMPAPGGLLAILDTPKSGDLKDAIAGYSKYSSMKQGQTIADYYSHSAKREVKETSPDGAKTTRAMTPKETAQKSKVMVAILIVSAMFWGTGALPIGITALFVGVGMYLFGVFPPDLVAQAYAKDAVIFIMGVLAMSAAIAKTGLDKRIGLLLLGTSRSVKRFLFMFCPLLAVTAGFLSEHALVAFIAPILMIVYLIGIRAAKIAKDRSLAVMLILAICFAANIGGPGSPAAGGRNAVMVGILSEYGNVRAMDEIRSSLRSRDGARDSGILLPGAAEKTPGEGPRHSRHRPQGIPEDRQNDGTGVHHRRRPDRGNHPVDHRQRIARHGRPRASGTRGSLGVPHHRLAGYQ
jgi:sodium-dependent dicarboxylate transporter 2/3/5